MEYEKNLIRLVKELPYSQFEILKKNLNEFFDKHKLNPNAKLTIKASEENVAILDWINDKILVHKEVLPMIQGISINSHDINFPSPNFQRLNKLYSIVINNQRLIEFPVGRDYFYVNGVLFIKLKNQSITSVDLSSPVTKPCFEAIYFLYRDSNKNHFTQKEILDSYLSIKREATEWNKFVEAITDIRKKIRTKKLTKRIILEYNRKLKSYIFEIIPRSSSEV